MKLHLLSLLIGFLASDSHARVFDPPIGIPDPVASFGAFDPIRTDRPDTTTHCPGWHEATPRPNTRAAGDARDAYYVDKYHPSATDTSNPFGSPARPRLTVPELPFVAGDYIEIHGDGDTATANPYTNPMRPRGSGTDSAPVWLVGVNSPVIASKLDIGFFSASPYSYLVFDGIHWRGVNCELRPRYDNNPISNVVIRNCAFKGAAAVADAAGIAIGASSPAAPGRTVTNVVIHNTEISHYGDWNAPGEEMGINMSARVHGLWVVDCNIHDVAEDGIQLGHGGLRTSNAIYIGRCNIYDNLTNALDFKGVGGPVVVSQCKIWGHKDVWIDGVHKSTGMGQSVTFHYAGSSSGPRNYLNHPEDVSFLFNHVEGSRISIRTSACGRLRIVGNSFLKTRRLPTGYTDASSALEIGGIKGDTWICHNTLYDCEGGIRVWDQPGDYNPTATYFRSATVSHMGKTMMCIDDNTDAGIMGIDPANDTHWKEIRMQFLGNIIANTFGGNNDIRFDGQKFYSDSVDIGFNCVFNPSAGGIKLTTAKLGPTDITTNPALKDPAAGDVTLTEGSPAINKASEGTKLTAYADYQARYGIEINRDQRGALRPSGTAWDMGAFEFGGVIPKRKLPPSTIPKNPAIKILPK